MNVLTVIPTFIAAFSAYSTMTHSIIAVERIRRKEQLRKNGPIFAVISNLVEILPRKSKKHNQSKKN